MFRCACHASFRTNPWTAVAAQVSTTNMGRPAVHVPVFTSTNPIRMMTVAPMGALNANGVHEVRPMAITTAEPNPKRAKRIRPAPRAAGLPVTQPISPTKRAPATGSTLEHVIPACARSRNVIDVANREICQDLPRSHLAKNAPRVGNVAPSAEAFLLPKNTTLRQITAASTG